MKQSKVAILGLSVAVMVIVGISFFVSGQPIAPINQNNPINRVENIQNLIEIPNNLLGIPQEIFIEPADPLFVQEDVEPAISIVKPANPPQIQESPVNASIYDLVSDVRFRVPVNNDDKDVGVKLLVPRDQVSIDALIESLRSFGDFFKMSNESLLDPKGEFAKRDREVMKNVKNAFRNPTEFLLGEQCGLEGPTFSYPPGWNDVTAACGGTPGFGGTSCNTDSPCFYTGFCFQECYSYAVGSYCYCWVPSCYGICGNSTYIWDSVTGICGCGT